MIRQWQFAGAFTLLLASLPALALPSFAEVDGVKALRQAGSNAT